MRTSFKDRLHYRIDTFLARGSSALFLALVITFLAAVAAAGGLRYLMNYVSPDPSQDFLRQLWVIFLQLTDPGNMAQDTETSVVFKVTAVVAGMAGVVIFSALIAFLTTALDQAIASLKKGHSRVLESGHTLILGWGPRVVEIITELLEANESEADPVVVVLADEDKESMDEYLRTAIPDSRNTRIITRSGPPAHLQTLARVSTDRAASAIVLANCGEAANAAARLSSDSSVIKTVLALTSQAGPRADFKIVAEIFFSRNRGVVEGIAPGRVAVVDAEDILAKIMVQTSRTSGLSVVYSELLSFEGCEMYFFCAPWKGVRFDACQFHFADGVPIGIRCRDGSMTIRPAPETVLADGDEVLIVAEDDSRIRFEPKPVVSPAKVEIPNRNVEHTQERNLILGWSTKAPIIISEYADYVLDGSTIDVVVKDPPAAVQAVLKELNEKLGSVSVDLIDKNPLVREELDSLDPLSYHNVLILPQHAEEALDPERIDTETIVVLLHLRRLVQQRKDSGQQVKTKLITEVLDSANQELVNQVGVNDFIISNRLVSMVFAQLSEDVRIQQVYDQLFEEAGSEIYVKPASLYFESLPASCTFADLMKRAQQRDGEICIGYKVGALAQDSKKNYGVELIPPKDQKLTISAEDGLVVVAEDDR